MPTICAAIFSKVLFSERQPRVESLKAAQVEQRQRRGVDPAIEIGKLLLIRLNEGLELELSALNIKGRARDLRMPFVRRRPFRKCGADRVAEGRIDELAPRNIKRRTLNFREPVANRWLLVWLDKRLSFELLPRAIELRLVAEGHPTIGAHGLGIENLTKPKALRNGLEARDVEARAIGQLPPRVRIHHRGAREFDRLLGRLIPPSLYVEARSLDRRVPAIGAYGLRKRNLTERTAREDGLDPLYVEQRISNFREPPIEARQRLGVRRRECLERELFPH